MAGQITGLQGLAGINAISEPESTAFATPEQRQGGTADPYHGHVGQQAQPYPWQSQMVQAGGHGPYGPENQLLDDPEYWFLESAGTLSDDPYIDRNAPNLSRSHGSVKNVGNSGPAPSQYEAINRQLDQMGNKSSNLGTSLGMQTNNLGLAQQDNWNEIWEVDNGSSDEPAQGKAYTHSSFGFGNNDRLVNADAKRNQYGFDSKHMHRRFAMSAIPGNHMWMRPGGRPLFKTMAGPARPPIGQNSAFTGQDIGFPFSYDTGAVLQDIPNQYVPPPSPNITQNAATYDNPYGTDSVELW